MRDKSGRFMRGFSDTVIKIFNVSGLVLPCNHNQATFP